MCSTKIFDFIDTFNAHPGPESDFPLCSIRVHCNYMHKAITKEAVLPIVRYGWRPEHSHTFLQCFRKNMSGCSVDHFILLLSNDPDYTGQLSMES